MLRKQTYHNCECTFVVEPIEEETWPLVDWREAPQTVVCSRFCM